MRLFLDTNVLVAAFATRGLCADLLSAVLAEHELVLGERLLAELRRVLAKKLRLREELIREIEELLRGQAVEIARAGAPLAVAADRDDAWILAEAAAGRADAFVSGDRALLAAAADLPFPRLAPRELWERLRAG